MKILKEAKEKMPVSFLTDMVSRCWDDVGYLKETIKSINENFSGTAKVEELLQDLLDAYLICIGQLEAHLEAKDYLEIPDEAKLTEAAAIRIKDSDVHIDNIIANSSEGAINGHKGDGACHKDTECNHKLKKDTPAAEKETGFVTTAAKAPQNTDFEFFVDFDEPTPQVGGPITDEEIEEMQKRD